MRGILSSVEDEEKIDDRGDCKNHQRPLEHGPVAAVDGRVGRKGVIQPETNGQSDHGECMHVRREPVAGLLPESEESNGGDDRKQPMNYLKVMKGSHGLVSLLLDLA